VFTSGNAVRALQDALATGGGTAPRGRVAAVGPATARAVRERLGWHVDVVPLRHVGASLVEAMREVAPVAGARVLWPRAESAREELPRDLEREGAVLDDPVAYRTVTRPAGAAELAVLLESGKLDAVVLTSPSAAACLAGAAARLGDAVLCVIGPSTGAEATRRGLRVDVEAAEHTTTALVEALREHLEKHSVRTDRRVPEERDG
jgi:uroporphyrinogen-III synthase